MKMQPTSATTAAKKSSCPSIRQRGRIKSTSRIVRSVAIPTSFTLSLAKTVIFGFGAKRNRITVNELAMPHMHQRS